MFFDDGELQTSSTQTGTHQQAVGEVNSIRSDIDEVRSRPTIFPTAVGYIDRRMRFHPAHILYCSISRVDIVNQLEDGIVDTYFLTFSLYLIV